MKRIHFVSAGERFSHIEIIGESQERCGGKPSAIYRCDCGKVKAGAISDIKSGRITSCGCAKAAKGVKRGGVRDGLSSHKLFHVWYQMIQRCTNPKHKNYKQYGARGIDVCPRWQESFKNFIADMGEESNGLTLDRIDNDKGYSVENCRWASRYEQGRNTRSCRWIEFKGERLTLSEWSRRLGLNMVSLSERIDKHGVEKALTMKKRQAKKITAFGESLTFLEWEGRTGIKARTIEKRLVRLGVTPEEALMLNIRKRNK